MAHSFYHNVRSYDLGRGGKKIGVGFFPVPDSLKSLLEVGWKEKCSKKKEEKIAGALGVYKKAAAIMNFFNKDVKIFQTFMNAFFANLPDDEEDIIIERQSNGVTENIKLVKL